MFHQTYRPHIFGGDYLQFALICVDQINTHRKLDAWCAIKIKEHNDPIFIFDFVNIVQSKLTFYLHRPKLHLAALPIFFYSTLQWLFLPFKSYCKRQHSGPSAMQIKCIIINIVVVFLSISLLLLFLLLSSFLHAFEPHSNPLNVHKRQLKNLEKSELAKCFFTSAQ